MVIVKAPKGNMIKVNHVMGTVTIAGNNEAVIAARQIEDAQFIHPNNESSNVIFVMALDTLGTHAKMDYEKQKSKYLSIGLRDSTAASVYLIIDYDIVPATEEELVWEYIGHTR